jgi:hypothetical protein
VEQVESVGILNEHDDQQANGKAHCQPEDVDERERLVAQQVAQGDFDVVGEHGGDDFLQECNSHSYPINGCAAKGKALFFRNLEKIPGRLAVRSWTTCVRNRTG